MTVLLSHSDPFALLGLPRSYYLDKELLETTFRRLAATYHPDHETAEERLNASSLSEKPEEEPGLLFQQLQEAAALLRNPATRLRYLSGTPPLNSLPLPPVAIALFSKVITALQETDALITKYHGTQGALAKAVMMEALLTEKDRLSHVHHSVQEWLQSLERQLQELDESKSQVASSFLLELAHSFTFAERWDRQLSERNVMLTILL